MNTKKTVIAACVAALFAAPIAAFAKEKWEYHEDQWGNVMSYGNVPLAQDSSGNWGPWSEFIVPAAGGPTINPAQFVGEGADERYRPNPQTIPPTPPVIEEACAAGTACGYAVFKDTIYTSYSGDIEKSDSSWDGGERPATFTARIPSKLDDSATTAWRITSLDGSAPLHYSESGELGNPYFNYSDFYFHRDDPVDGAEGSSGAWIEGSHMAGEGLPVATGYFGRNLLSYITGDSCDDGCIYERWDDKDTRGPFVAGIVTSAADMAALRASGFSAEYVGRSFHNGNPVSITVNFGPGTGTWSGSWNNGADGSSTGIYTYAGSSQQYVYGQVGFRASGTINGSNIQSDKVWADDGAASGMVKGSFYGAQAAALGGVVDITKSKTVAIPTAATAVPAGEYPTGYTNARHVDLFLTVDPNKVRD